MSDELDDIVDNLQEPSAWIRIIFMIGYAFLLYLVIVPVMFVLGLVQALFAIITGEDNEKLRGLGGALAEFVQQLLSFLTYNTDEKPFPFKDFPEFTYGDDSGSEKKSSSTGSKSASKKTAARKSTKKKTSKKKTTAKKKSTASKKSKSDSSTDAGDSDADKNSTGD